MIIKYQEREKVDKVDKKRPFEEFEENQKKRSSRIDFKGGLLEGLVIYHRTYSFSASTIQ